MGIPILAVDLGATNLRFALVSGEGVVLTKSRRSTKGQEGAARTLEKIYDGIFAVGGAYE